MRSEIRETGCDNSEIKKHDLAPCLCVTTRVILSPYAACLTEIWHWYDAHNWYCLIHQPCEILKSIISMCVLIFAHHLLLRQQYVKSTETSSRNDNATISGSGSNFARFELVASVFRNAPISIIILRLNRLKSI